MKVCMTEEEFFCYDCFQGEYFMKRICIALLYLLLISVCSLIASPIYKSFTVNGETWLPLDMENADGSIFTEDRPIIHNLPLICFPAFVRQFKSLFDDDMSEVWDAWDTISCYM